MASVNLGNATNNNNFENQVARSPVLQTLLNDFTGSIVLSAQPGGGYNANTNTISINADWIPGSQKRCDAKLGSARRRHSSRAGSLA